MDGPGVVEIGDGVARIHEYQMSQRTCYPFPVGTHCKHA